jgi:hypothetical protein
MTLAGPRREHEQEGRLLDAVVAELLAGGELDQHDPLGAVARVENDGRAGA